MLQGTRKRIAMTLVELLVVMAIIVIFTAMTAAFYPANQADRELSRFSNTVQSALLSARNRAKADRLPTGIRFYDSDANGKVDSVVLIQKPAPLDSYAVGVAPNPSSLSATIVERNPMSGVLDVYITFPNITFPNPFPNLNIINPGDFVALDSGDVAKIDSLIQPTMANPNPNTIISLSGSYSSGFSSSLKALPTKFKVYRSAVELSGDTPFELSNTIEILGQGSFSTASDIIFNPDGSLNNSPYDVYLHLHNFEAVAGDYSRDAILAVRKMSGSIGVYEFGPVDLVTPANHNPYLFAKDPRNKGI
jgi:type II secretory pathway pseudopilin PulG